MSDHSKIEWTDASWNPIRARNLKTGKVGWHCEHVTTGCEFCYAEAMNKRLGTGLPFKPGHRQDIEIFLDEEMLLPPLRWKRPRMIFVCSMTDLFASFVKDEWIDKLFAVMALCPQHTFQVLTKRPERMREYVSAERAPFDCADAALVVGRHLPDGFPGWNRDNWKPSVIKHCTQPARWPLPNVWLGTSCERQEEADERIPSLLETPAAFRFVSLEPLLGPINLGPFFVRGTMSEADIDFVRIAGTETEIHALDWVIVGGESGGKARPMHPQWARDIRDQCEAAGVSFLFKQWGEWIPKSAEDGWTLTKDHIVFEDGEATLYRGWPPGGGTNAPPAFLERVGKKAAGRLLDGRTWDEFPVARR